MPKCKACSKEFKSATDMLKIKDRVYVCDETCKAEYEAKLNKSKPNQTVSAPSDWKMLMEYLKQLYGENCNYGMLCSQIKKMQNDYGYKCSGILLTLRYMYETLELPFDPSNGLGLVAYKYNEAKQHYIKMHKIKKAIEQADWNDETVVVKKVIDRSGELWYYNVEEMI